MTDGAGGGVSHAHHFIAGLFHFVIAVALLAHQQIRIGKGFRHGTLVKKNHIVYMAGSANVRYRFNSRRLRTMVPVAVIARRRPNVTLLHHNQTNKSCWEK